MLKPGDTVRYLNDVGGGTVTRVEGKMAYVDDNGFETPVLAAELVVVLPAGHEPQAKGARLMFDQSARDAAVSRSSEPKRAEASAVPQTAPAEPLPAPDTPHGDKLSLALAFEPSSTRDLAKAEFNAVLVNDSNYWLDFSMMRRGADDRVWTSVYHGTLPPNELMDLASLTHAELPGLERVALQAIAYKKGKPFEMKPPVNVVRRLDLTKFHKLHCFRPGIYFDSPVLEIQLLKDDVEQGRSPEKREEQRRVDAGRLAEKYRVDPRMPKRKRADADNPHKLLPPIEVDLHAEALLDTTAGMDNTAIMQVQLDTVRRTMGEHSRRIGQKVIFIHGKGDGVLRKAVLALLKKEYPKATTQDASFREYGFGATLVTIH